MTVLDLLQIDLATLFMLTKTGRIQHGNEPVPSPGPRLYLAGCELGNVVRIRDDVEEETARAINALVADEPPLRDLDSAPRPFDDYMNILSEGAPIEQRNAGLVYMLPNRLGYKHDVALVNSETPEGARLHARLTNQGMPQALVELGFVEVTNIWLPWCIALHKGKIASIGFGARIGPTGAEAGVTTVSALRGRGFAAAATAGWTLLPSLQGRALFYSTDRTNVSSQRVTDRLGLRFIGASLRIT